MPSKAEKEKKYANVSLQHLMNLKKRLKAVKQMCELIRIRNENLANQDYYNKKIEYDKLRHIVASRIPHGSMNNDFRAKAGF